MKQVHKYISLLFAVGIMSAQLYANISKDEAINILYANISDTASVEYASLERKTHYFDTDHTLCFYGKDDGIIKYTLTSSEALVDIPFAELSDGLYVVKLFVSGIENDSKQVYISKNGLLWGL